MNRKLLIAGLGAIVIVAALIILVIGPGKKIDSGATPITFATDWKAQAEHGGFYQALARGYYKDAGLDVTIQQGGPGVNVPQLLATHTIQFGMGSNSFIPMNVVAAKAGSKAVMASFQKDPQVLVTHPRDDIKSIADMKGQPILVADATVGSFWQWLKAKYGFTDDQILLSDNGYPGYAAFIMATDNMIAEHPDVVQKFVDASIRGWVEYLYGDNTAANELIKADNPEMTDALLAHGLATLKQYGIVDSGDTETLGIGAMTEERWKSFHDEMSGTGVFPSDIDVHSAFTLEFVNQGVGNDLKADLMKK